MPDLKDHQAFFNLCEMAIDNMYELEALGELLEQKGLLTRQEIHSLAKDFKQKSLPTDPGTASQLDTRRFTETENAVIEQLMARDPSTWSDCRPCHEALRPDHSALGIMGKQAAHEMPEANA